MSDPIRISAKAIGELALPDFCPRCFWRKTHVSKLPYQIFPGIFNSIDSYTKKVVHRWFDTYKSTPPWLSTLGDLDGYVPIPHHTKFSVVDAETGILLTGMPDDIFRRRDSSHIIVDYKTARYTGTQDQLFPLYEAQLNAYALISAQRGPQPVTGLALIYMEPVTDDGAAKDDKNLRGNGFAMGFAANVQEIKMNTDIVLTLLRRTRALYDLSNAPSGRDGCVDCQLVDELIAVASK
jgi:hypothetical protein